MAGNLWIILPPEGNNFTRNFKPVIVIVEGKNWLGQLVMQNLQVAGHGNVKNVFPHKEVC